VASADELARVPLFAAMQESDRQELAAAFNEKTVDAGARLIGEGAHGYSFFVLIEGNAAVTSGTSTIADLGPGDFFGEIAILRHSRRTASVITTSSARLLVMHGGEFRRLQQAQPEIAARIEEAMLHRLSRDGLA
jgi:CRP-like cAMP-binding protein